MNEDKIKKRREELRLKNKKNNKFKEFLAVFIIIIMVSCIAILSYSYYLTTPVDKDNNNKINVEVKESYGASAIANILYEKNLIKSPIMFKIYSKLGAGNEFYVGNFEISQNMNISEILTVLTSKDKANSGKMLSIIEGENIKTIAKKVSEITSISEDEFLKTVNNQEFINKLKKEFPNLITNDLDSVNLKYKLEGYLYPAKYNIDASNENNVELLIKQMISTTNSKVIPYFEKNNKNWNIAGVDKEITIHDYITMASILEKESTANNDNETIAGVFLNRLSLNMALQTDPTVYYSVNRQQSSGVITIQELQNKDLYNTYVYPGLPPGPIASPGEASYKALNNSKNHDYIYFLHAKDGKAYFSKTYAEHQELARKYIEGYVTIN